MASGDPLVIRVFETNGEDRLLIVWIVMGLVPLASLDLCLRDGWIIFLNFFAECLDYCGALGVEFIKGDRANVLDESAG